MQKKCPLLILTIVCRACLIALFTLLPLVFHTSAYGKDEADFDESERQNVTDDFSHFPRKALPHLIPMNGYAAWLDDSQILLTVSALPSGWLAGKEPIPASPLSPTQHPRIGNSRIVVLNVDTGEIRDAVYSVGTLECYGNGTIVIQIASEVDNSAEYYAGRYGEKLEKLDIIKKGYRPRFSSVQCRQIEFENHLSTLLLRPEDGYLKVQPGSFHDPNYWTNLYFYRADGTQVSLTNIPSDAAPDNIRYLEYSGQYVSENIFLHNAKSPGFFMSLEGKISYIDMDPFVGQLANEEPYGGGIQSSEKWCLLGLHANPALEAARIIFPGEREIAAPGWRECIFASGFTQWLQIVLRENGR